jgi:hypothetical protein
MGIRLAAPRADLHGTGDEEHGVDVVGITAVGLVLVGVALTLVQADVGGPASDVSFVAGFLVLLSAWYLYRRDPASAR